MRDDSVPAEHNMLVISAIWLPATLVAALCQAWRTALQQRLRGVLSVNGAGLVRYLYGVPMGAAILGVYLTLADSSMPSIGTFFLLWASVGGIFQIVATNLLIMAFGYRNFVVGTAYSKTEAVQGAVLAWLLLGEALSPLAWLGVIISVSGVLVLSLAGLAFGARELMKATTHLAALCGLAAGFFFAMAAISIKSAIISLAANDLLLGALVTLVATNILQTFVQGAWIAWHEPRQLRQVLITWRSSALVGALSACGSACWFTGFAMAPIALVRAVGQIEVIFTLLFGRFYLRETPTSTDLFGSLILVLGVVLILLGL